MMHVFSTAANSTMYVKYAENRPSNLNIVEREVEIKGGSGVATTRLMTPLGVHTEVKDEDYAWLKDHPLFKQSIAAGYITVRERSTNAEKVAANMVTHDQRTDACPIVPQDYSEKPVGENLTAITPLTNKKAA